MSRPSTFRASDLGPADSRHEPYMDEAAQLLADAPEAVRRALLSVAKLARPGYSHTAEAAALELIVEHMEDDE